jgi:hypothetical protein
MMKVVMVEIWRKVVLGFDQSLVEFWWKVVMVDSE